MLVSQELPEATLGNYLLGLRKDIQEILNVQLLLDVNMAYQYALKAETTLAHY